jgi:undecaprenol kinase/diacylglycerol kinase (ATP)
MKFLKAFSFACNGIRICFRSGTNFKIHLLSASAVAVFAWVLDIGTVQWALLLLAAALVIAMEMMNTAIEKLCDKVEPGFDPLIKIVKDVSAGVVLVMAICSMIIGVIVFLPAIFSCLKNG